MAEILPDAPLPITFEYKAPPFKKRKFLRQRNVDEDEDRSKSPEQTATSTSNSGTADLNETKARDSDSKARDEEPESDLSLAEITKLRKKNARIRQGLQLTVPTPSGKEQDQPQNASEEGKRNAEIVAITNRFTHQTGQVLDVDKHMMEYIEKRMSSKSAAQNSDSSHSNASSRSNSKPIDAQMQMRGATLGKLHEIDLGEEIKLKNAMRTEAAVRRLEGGQPVEPEEEQTGKKKWRKRRRNSQDIQRDKLVEEVLKETRLELYEEPQDSDSNDDQEGATDDKIVEKFRKEFMDALNQRKGRRKTVQTTKKKDEKARPKGPKLGGSRMARAAMREQQTGAKK